MRKTYLPILILTLAAPLAPAQETAAPAAKPERGPRLAVINMERIYAESLLGKSYAKRLEELKNEIDAEGQKKQADLNKIDAAIKALQEELEKQGGVMSPEAVEKKTAELKKKQRDRQAFVEDGQGEIQRMRERAQQQAQAYENEFGVKIRPHIEAVVKEKSIDILLDSRVVVSATKETDVSLDVINRSNDAEKAAKPAAAAAPPKPAAPAAPAPAAPTPAPTPTPNP
ncbi:MAG TPA: OmpH family outer membrane protein [Vicinamibacteria bacterium]|nr:OmpH family outer membrane protein [Vicinamibacteria bacterium]